MVNILMNFFTLFIIFFSFSRQSAGGNVDEDDYYNGNNHGSDLIYNAIKSLMNRQYNILGKPSALKYSGNADPIKKLR